MLTHTSGMARKAVTWLIVHSVLALGLVVLADSAALATPDETPQRTWQTNGRVRAILYRRNVVYLAGDFTRVRPPGTSSGGVKRNHAAAFRVDTGQLLPWDPNVNGPVYAMAATTKAERIYLGGSFDKVHGKFRRNIAKVNAKQGGGPRSWNPEVNAIVRAILVRSDGKRVWIGGRFTKVNDKKRKRLAKLFTKDPKLVKDWTPSVGQVDGRCPPRCLPNVTALAKSRDERYIFVGGTFSRANGKPRNSTALFDAVNGKLRRWNPRVFRSGSMNNVLDLERVGSRMFICGNYQAVGGVVSPNLAAVNTTTGARQKGFVATTDGAIPSCQASKTTLYVGGHFAFAGGFNAKKTGKRRVHLAAFDVKTGALREWNPGANTRQGVYALALSGKRLAAGGEFTVIGDRRQQGFAQFNGKP